MNKILTALLGPSLLAAPALAQDAPQQRRDPMARADANNDGVVTREEAIAAADARFARMDSNGDGKVTADERSAMGGRMGGGGGQRGPGMDANNDGVITLDELRAQSLARFTAADTNQDGKVDQAERAAAAPPPPPAG